MFLKLQISIVIFLSCFLVQASQADLNEELYQAVKQGNAEKVDQLISAGADPHAKVGRDKNSFLHIAENLEVARRLLDAGVDPNVKNSDGEGDASLHTIENLEVIRLLLAVGADPNIRGKLGKVPLHKTKNHEKAKALLSAGAYVDARDINERTALHEAVAYKDIEMLRILLEAGANPNARGIDGKTPYHILSEYRSSEYAELLLDYGANPNLKDNEGNLPRYNEIIDPKLLDKKRTLLVPKLSSKPEKEKGTSCEYTTESTRVSPAQCGRRDVCIAEVSCTFKIGIAPNTTQIEKKFQVVCSSLSDGQCPKANDCVLDRSVVEAEKTKTESRSSSGTAPSSSSGVH